jgi:hypothetical protein
MIPLMAGQAGMSVNDRYVLLELIGQGDTGRVWRSRDRVLDREVAVKEVLLPPDLPPSDRAQLLARMREAQAAAGLDHPSINSVFDVTEFDGVPWIVTRLVNGPSLTAVLERDGRLRWRRVAEIGEQVADALSWAHAAGVVHRDLTPGNILLTERRAVVTDFGIADIASATATLTHPGMSIGTPQYMAPEQFDERPARPATDMWALGAILYEAAEGRPPFGGSARSAVIDAVLTKSPDVPANAGPLADLIQSLLSKEASERPDAATTAGVLAGLRSASAQELAGTRGSAPDPATAPVALPGILLPAAITVPPPLQPPPAAASATTPAPARTAGGRPTVEPRTFAVIAVSAFAVTAVIAAAIFLRASSGPGPSPSGYSSLQTFPPVSPSTAPSAARAVSLTVSGSLLAKLSNPARVDSVAFAPDGKTLAAGAENGSTYLWNTATDSRTAAFNAPAGQQGNFSVCVAFAPDGKTVASSDVNGSTYLWDAATGTKTATLTNPGSQGADTVAFLSGGKTIATSDENGNVYLWNAGTHAQTGSMAGVGGTDVFTPDGATIGYVAAGGGAGVWQSAGPTTNTYTDPSGKNVQVVALTPDGRTLATADASGNTYLWDTSSQEKMATLADPGGQSIWALAFTADGKVLATGDTSGNVYLWDARTGRQMAALTGPGSLIGSLAFTRDGRTLAASDYDGHVYLWRITGA